MKDIRTSTERVPRDGNLEATGVQQLARRRILSLGLGFAVAPCFAPLGEAATPAMVNQTQYDAYSVMASYPEFSDWQGLLQLSGLAPYARGPGPFTIFVPTNGAYYQYPMYYQTLVPNGVAMPNTTRLIAYVRMHVVLGLFPPTAFYGHKVVLRSVSMVPITVDGTGPGTPTVTYSLLDGKTASAELSEAPIQASNGIIYPINNATIL